MQQREHGTFTVSMVQPSTDLLERVDLLRLDATRAFHPQQRAALGQFLTPAPIARLMASMLPSDTTQVRLLDAGAGVGTLISAAVEELCCRTRLPEHIHVTAYEIDPVLVAYLDTTLQWCAAACASRGIGFASEVLATDFVAHAVEQLASPLFVDTPPAYTGAILNPPYRKIKTSSDTRQLLRRAGIETSNLYTGFVALAMQLLAPGGTLVGLTPRSFCNGPYFRPFRAMLLGTMALRQFHLFESRQQAFHDDAVLQENVVFSAMKSVVRPTTIAISTSTGPDDDMLLTREVRYDEVVHPNDPDAFIHLVADGAGQHVAASMASLHTPLDALGLTVSIGRVVDFRVAEDLRHHPAHDTAPLIYPTHLEAGRVVWPKPSSKKPNALAITAATCALLIPNECYVLIKRFSAKEERRRVIAAVHDPDCVPADVVGFENHLNYVHANGRGLNPLLARGLAMFLNSTVVDAYVRQFNGHTQVNATDLRSLHYPSREHLLALGAQYEQVGEAQDDLDALIADEVFGMTNAPAADPLFVQKRIAEALTVLRKLGLPRAQQNERSALTLLALLDLTPTMSWADARNPLRGITPMMDFFAEHYGKQYKPNTRETVRRQTVHQFLDAGLIIANPDQPTRAINSPRAVYQIAPDVLPVLRAFGTDVWNQHLHSYLASVQTLQERYAQERAMQRLPVRLPSGAEFMLSPGGQNVLIKQVIEEFAPRFVPGGELLYVGDTDEKFAIFEEARLQALGVTVDTHGKMPDVMMYHTEKRWREQKFF